MSTILELISYNYLMIFRREKIRRLSKLNHVNIIELNPTNFELVKTDTINDRIIH